MDPDVLPAKPGMTNQDIQLTNHASASLGSTKLSASTTLRRLHGGASARGSQPIVRAMGQLGDTLELTVTNMTGAHHPFHLHGFDAADQPHRHNVGPPPAPNGGGDKSPGIWPPYTFPYHEFRDTIDAPRATR